MEAEKHQRGRKSTMNLPCLKHASAQTLTNLHDHKYLGPALSFISALDDVETIRNVLSIYNNADESEWGLRYEKWRRHEQEEKNPNSRKNLLTKLEELKIQNNDLLNQYKLSKKSCDELNAKIYSAKSAKAMRNTGDALLKELDKDTEANIAEDTITFGPVKLASSRNLTLSFEIGNVVHLAARRTSTLLGVSDLFVYDECPIDLSGLLRSYGLTPVLVILRRKMRAIYEHWSSSDYSSQAKLLSGAHDLLLQNPDVCSAQRIAFMARSDIFQLPAVPHSHSISESNCTGLDSAFNQLKSVYEDIFDRVGTKARTFDEEFVPTISKAIDALSYDALSISRQFTSLFEEFDLVEYSRILVVPSLPMHSESFLRPLTKCHEFINRHMLNSLRDQLNSMLQTISKEDEQVAAKSLELLLSNVLVRLKNNTRSLEDKHLNSLEEARIILTSDIPDKLARIKKLEPQKNRLYSAEFQHQISSFSQQRDTKHS